MKTTLQLNELELFCLVQALRIVETKDNVEREKLSGVFEQLNLLEYDAKFAKSPDRTFAEMQAEVKDFEVEDYVLDFIISATEKVNVKGPFQINMGMLAVTKKAKAVKEALPVAAPEKK